MFAAPLSPTHTVRVCCPVRSCAHTAGVCCWGRERALGSSLVVFYFSTLFYFSTFILTGFFLVALVVSLFQLHITVTRLVLPRAAVIGANFTNLWTTRCYHPLFKP